MAASLRDQLAENYDKIVTVPDAPVPDAVETTDAPAPAAEAHVSKIGQAPPTAKATPAGGDDRPRDPETGKFVPKEEAKAEVKTAAKIHKAPAPGTPQAEAALATQPPAVPAKPRPPRPSSWKKDYWEHWDKLDPSLAEYLNQRESEFAKGVSTYKKEWDNARPLIEAVSQFTPELQKYGMAPEQFITNMGNAYRVLALGAPNQKLHAFAQLAQEFGIPLQALTDAQAQQQFMQQGQFTPQYQPPVPPQQQTLTRAEAEKLFQEQYLQRTSEQELQRFSADTEKHPHYEAVRKTMAQLIDANLAEDLESAYQAALRLPQHADIYTAIQEQERAGQEEARRAAEAQRVMKAKAKAVSTATATPSAAAEDRPKGLRSSLESAYDTHMGGSRV